ncbi:lysylphosphatidylglycerol synthetase-like protein (DUF2156 family) [Pseudomonas frederiksbergensis]
MDFYVYLGVVADSLFFGCLALLCLLLAVSGISSRIRNNWIHRFLTFVCLMSIPVIELIGSYYANLPPA